MKILDVAGRGRVNEGDDTGGMREDFLEPRMIRDDKPWVKWYESVRNVPVVADRFKGLPYDKMDRDMRLQVKNMHLEATKRQRTLDETGRDDIYINDLVELFGKLDAAANQNEANRIQKQVISILSRAGDPQQLAADAFDTYTRSLAEQAAPAPKMPAGGWELPSISDFAKEKFGITPGTIGAPANVNVPQQGIKRAENKVMNSLARWAEKSRLGGRAGALLKGAAAFYMLQDLFSGSPEPASTGKPAVGGAAGTAMGAFAPDAAKPMGTAIGGTAAAQSPASNTGKAMGAAMGAFAPDAAKPMGTAIGAMGGTAAAQSPASNTGKAMGAAMGAFAPDAAKPMGTAIGGTAAAQSPASNTGKAMGAAMGAFAPDAAKPMGTAIGTIGSTAADQDAGGMQAAEFDPTNIAAQPAQAPAAPAQEPAAPAQAPAQEPAAPAEEPALAAEPDAQQGTAKVVPVAPPSAGSQPPSGGVQPQGGTSAVVPPPAAQTPPPGKKWDYTQGADSQPQQPAVTPTGTAPAAPPKYAGSRPVLDDPTFKQAFARARQRAEMLPDDDPDKYTFKWRNPKTGKVGDFQTNYKGKGTKRRPQEPYIPQSKQKGYMSTAPIANPYENPAQFKGGKKKKKKKSTNEAAWAKAQMLRMNRHAPELYRDLVSEHSREAVAEAIMEMDSSDLRRDITDRQIAELYVLRARKHMAQVDDPHIMEGASPSDIAHAISHRLMHSGKAAELLKRYGVERLMDAIGSVAEFHQGAEELGSSDISIMVKQVLSHLGESAEYDRAYESANDFIGTIRNAVASAVKGDKRGATAALDAAKNAQNNSNLPIAGGTTPPAKPSGTGPAPGSFADSIAKAVDASKKNDKQGMQKAIDAAKAASTASKPNDPKDKELLAQLSESPAMGDIVIMELADGRLLQSRISELSGNSMVIDLDETGMQWLEESPDHSALRIGTDGKRVSAIAEQWNSMVDSLDRDTPEGWARVFAEHASRTGADAAGMPRAWGRIWRQQHERLGDSLTRQDQLEWMEDVSGSISRLLAEDAETNGQFTRHRLSMKDPAMLATWMKSQSGVRGEPVKKFARGVARKAGKPEDEYWGKIHNLVSEKQDGATTDAEDMIAAGFTDVQIGKVTGLDHKHIAALRKRMSRKHHEYDESVGYSEPYEVGRKQGMHNINSNPYSKGSPASQRWSAGHMAAVQGLGEDGIGHDLGREITPDKVSALFGDEVMGDPVFKGRGTRVEFFRDKRGDAWRLVISDDGRIFVKRDTMMEDGEDAKMSRRDNRLWLMITDYEERARKTKNDLKRDHYMRMAADLRDKLTTNDMATESRVSAAMAIDRFFGGMAESLVKSVIRRAGILAMQGRHGEAEVLLQKAMRDADPEAAKKVADAVRKIKPVTIGSRTADSSALEKSAEHNDWLDNTFIPWVMKGLGLNETLRDTDILTDPLGSDMDRKEALKVIQDIVSKMPDRMQVAVRMYMDGSKKADIARELGLSDTRASQLLDKALHTIRKRFMFKPSEFDDMKAAKTNLSDFKARMNRTWSSMTDEEKAAIRQMIGMGFGKNWGKVPPAPPAFSTAWKKMYRHIPVPSSEVFRSMLYKARYDQMDQMRKSGDEYLDYDDMVDDANRRAFSGLAGLEEAKYHGKEVPLGKPIRTNTSSGGKFKVYVRDPKTGNIKMVRFGDTTGLSIKRDDPKRRKSFRARHHCDNPGPRTKARYWSCRMWTSKPVGKILKGK